MENNKIVERIQAAWGNKKNIKTTGIMLLGPLGNTIVPGVLWILIILAAIWFTLLSPIAIFGSIIFIIAGIALLYLAKYNLNIYLGSKPVTG